MKPRVQFFACCLLLWLVSVVVVRADEKPPRIKPEEARKHIDQKVEIVFEVKGSKDSVKRKTVYLDSEADFRDEKNVGVAISEKGVASLKEKRKVDAPAEYYRGKIVLVVGVVVIEEERVYIKVDDAEQLDLFTEKSGK